MNETWNKRLLLGAAAWNILGGVSALLDPAQHFAQLYTLSLNLSDSLQLYFFRCTWINVIAWGVGYALAGYFPAARSPVLAAGAAGKVIYALACMALYLSGAGTGLLVMAGVVDVLLATVFIAVLLPRASQHRFAAAG